jgi:hypothetical protein
MQKIGEQHRSNQCFPWAETHATGIESAAVVTGGLINSQNDIHGGSEGDMVPTLL